jgi:hypothetical protein
MPLKWFFSTFSIPEALTINYNNHQYIQNTYNTYFILSIFNN